MRAALPSISKRYILHLFLFLSVLMPASKSLSADKSPAPNIIIIFCDDLGYGDIGCFGSKKHRTPHLDQMAKEGLRMTSFYSTCGVCTPSRSSLMTGCYPRRVNMHQSARGEWVLFPVAARGLHPDEVTIADMLKSAGYATAAVGKWHLGDQPEFLPTKQGFDQYFGIPYSNDMGSRQRKINPPLPLMRNDMVIEAPVDQNTVTRRYTEEAVKFIEANRKGPFFLYMPHTMPHNPVHSSDDFRGKSANGGYGDCVEEIDWSTGQILAALKRLKIDEQTMVVFTSDNGASNRFGGSNAPLSGFKGSTMEGGMREPCVIRYPGKIAAGSVCDEIASTIDLLPTAAYLAGKKLADPKRIDGHNIWPLLSQQEGAKTPHQAYYYYFRDSLQAVRSGPWKLHLTRNARRRGKNQAVKKLPMRLYNLDDDIAESNNVAESNPKVVERLLALCETARNNWGDGKQPGKLQRPAGHHENPEPLVLNKSE